jgi:uncharacterized protein
MPRKSSASVKVFYPDFGREELIEKLKARMPELAKKLPLKSVFLFGSWAKGNHTVASDIDLLIVYSGRKREDAFAVAKTTIAIPGVEPHIYSEQESAKIKPVIDRMLEGSVKIFKE